MKPAALMLQGTGSARAISMFDKWEADAIVGEINQGGDMVKSTVQTIRPGVRFIEVRATRGKHVRAEPISALYEVGNVSHVGTFHELDNQMCLASARFGGRSSEPPLMLTISSLSGLPCHTRDPHRGQNAQSTEPPIVAGRVQTCGYPDSRLKSAAFTSTEIPNADEDCFWHSRQ